MASGCPWCALPQSLLLWESAWRDVPLAAWPRDALAAIRLCFGEAKPRAQRGGDPAARCRLLAGRRTLKKTQVVQHQQELAGTLALTHVNLNFPHASSGYSCANLALV